MRLLVRGRNPAADLTRDRMTVQERKQDWIGIAVLHLEHRPVDGSSIQTGRRPRLKAALPKPKVIESRREANRRLIAHPTPWPRLISDVNRTSQECPGRQDDRTNGQARAIRQFHALDAARIHKDVDDFALNHLKAGLRSGFRLHRLAIQLAIGLGPRPLHSGALSPVQKPELDARPICDAAHHTVQCIDLAHEMALAKSSDGRVAGHDADPGPVQRDQHGRHAHPRRGMRASVPAWPPPITQTSKCFT